MGSIGGGSECEGSLLDSSLHHTETLRHAATNKVVHHPRPRGLGHRTLLQPETRAQHRVFHVAIDLDTVLAHSQQR